MRHAGIALALLILAPIAQHELDTTLQDTRLRGVALILDAQIDPQLKLEIAPQLGDSVETEDPRGGLESVFADARDEVDDDQLAAYDDLTQRADDLLVTGVNEGFRTAFLVAAGLALIAAALLALRRAHQVRGTLRARKRADSRHLAAAALGLAHRRSLIAVVHSRSIADSGAGRAGRDRRTPANERDLPEHRRSDGIRTGRRARRARTPSPAGWAPHARSSSSRWPTTRPRASTRSATG